MYHKYDDDWVANEAYTTVYYLVSMQSILLLLLFIFPQGDGHLTLHLAGTIYEAYYC
jgi:hypothetical protein